MPITYWNEAVVLGPVLSAYPQAVAETVAETKALAPGPATREGTRYVPTGETSGAITAEGVPNVGLIISGTRPGLRITSGWFVFGGTVVQQIQHPGTPPHHWLQEGASRFRGNYVSAARARFGFLP